jgi:integrase
VTQRRTKGSGQIDLLASGRWRARYVDQDGHLVSAPVTFDAKIDAAGWLSSRANDEPEPGRPEDVTLREFATAWVSERDLKPRTRAHYDVLLDRMILPGLGARRLSKITVDQVHRWHASLDATTPTMRAHAYGLLRTIMQNAWQRDLIPANPCRLRGAGSTRPAHQTQPATVAELDTIRAAMPERYRAMVDLAAWCALRYGEVTELRRADVDLTRKVVHVRRGVVRVGSEFVVGDPKSHAGVRSVSIPPHLLPVLAEHLAEHVGRDPGALMFPAAGDRDRHLAPSTWCKVWYPARDKAGRPDLRFHDLRHTGLTLAAATGATLADLMARAGHSTASAAMVYQHAVADHDQAIAEALSGFSTAKVVPLKARRRS